MLKGKTKIELKNVNTGETTTVESDNMFTHALDEVLNGTNFGIGTINKDNINNYLPIITTTLGGILLFDKEIEENPDTIFPPTAPIGFGGNTTDAGDDTKLGTYNLSESHAVSNGYVHVWDFSTSQGNGTISCVGLTHAEMGNNFRLNTNYLMSNIYKVDKYQGNSIKLHCIDKSENIFIYYIPNTYTFTIQKLNIITDTIKSVNANIPNLFNNSMFDEILGTIDISNLSTQIQTNLNNNYGIYRTVNKQIVEMYSIKSNTASNTVIYKCTIHVDTFTIEVGEITIPDMLIYNTFMTTINSFAAIRHGYLYGHLQDTSQKNIIVKINLTNLTDIKLIELPTVNDYKMFYIESADIIVVDNSYIIYPDDSIQALSVYKSSSSSSSSLLMLLSDKLKTWYVYNQATTFFTAIDSLKNYLATINNISPITKTPAQTMKITYTIIDSTEVILMSIAVTSNPTTQVYNVGDTLNLDGLEITATYSDETTQIVTDECIIAPSNGTVLIEKITEINISYEDNGITRYTKCPIIVN